jgi:hypothetical protein
MLSSDSSPSQSYQPASWCDHGSRTTVRLLVLAHIRTPLTSMHRLYVGSLHFNLTESDIKQVFEPFGELEFVDLHRDPGTGRSKGYCFIQCVTVVVMAGRALMTGPAQVQEAGGR